MNLIDKLAVEVYTSIAAYHADVSSPQYSNPVVRDAIEAKLVRSWPTLQSQAAAVDNSPKVRIAHSYVNEKGEMVTSEDFQPLPPERHMATEDGIFMNGRTLTLQVGSGGAAMRHADSLSKRGGK